MYEQHQLFDSMLLRVQQVGAINGLKPPQAFARWFAEMYFQQPRDFFVADGPGDARVDLFFTTSNGKEVQHHVLNTKFTEKYSLTAPVSFYNEITAFWQAFKNRANRGQYLAKLVRHDARAHYRKLFDHYDEGRARLYFLTNCQRNETQYHAVSDYEVDVFHFEDVMQFMTDYIEDAMPYTPPLRLTGISTVLSADPGDTEVPTSIVFARLADFIRYMKDDPYDLLFNRNVRVWLGKTPVNDDIAQTFEESPKEFVYSNNGITVLCEDYSHSKHELVIKNPRVVNGSQTLHSVRNLPNPKDSARVMVRIITVSPLGAEDLPARVQKRKEVIRNIAVRSNFQNPVKKWDLVSNDDFQLELARYFRAEKCFYERRRREWKERRTELKSLGVKRGPEIRRVAQLIASFHWDKKFLGPVVAKEPGLLFEGKAYTKIAETKAEVAYQLFLLNSIIELHVRELARAKRYVRILSRHMNYCLFALIVKSLRTADAKWGSDDLTKLMKEEEDSLTKEWRHMIECAIGVIRKSYRLEAVRYQRANGEPLPIVNFFKSQTNVGRILSGPLARKLKRAVGKAV